MLTEMLPEPLGIVSWHGSNNALSGCQRCPPR
ncbi:hypothetical protein JOH51_000175 [Rhizobium leguminosarum]|nr:hypothetical protein [Rhizobium leguminosarum]